MPKEDQDHYARVSAEIGRVSIEVEGNHSLEAVQDVFEEELASVCAKAEEGDSNNAGAIK